MYSSYSHWSSVLKSAIAMPEIAAKHVHPRFCASNSVLAVGYVWRQPDVPHTGSTLLRCWLCVPYTALWRHQEHLLTSFQLLTEPFCKRSNIQAAALNRAHVSVSCSCSSWRTARGEEGVENTGRCPRATSLARLPRGISMMADRLTMAASDTARQVVVVLTAGALRRSREARRYEGARG